MSIRYCVRHGQSACWERSTANAAASRFHSHLPLIGPRRQSTERHCLQRRLQIANRPPHRGKIVQQVPSLATTELLQQPLTVGTVLIQRTYPTTHLRRVQRAQHARLPLRLNLHQRLLTPDQQLHRL